MSTLYQAIPPIEDEPESLLNKVVYLGDGLYAKWDGYQIYLMANHHEHPTDKVALDSYVLRAFLRYVEQLKGE